MNLALKQTECHKTHLERSRCTHGQAYARIHTATLADTLGEVRRRHRKDNIQGTFLFNPWDEIKMKSRLGNFTLGTNTAAVPTILMMHLHAY